MAKKTKVEDVSSFKIREGDSILIRQIRSDIGRPKDQRETLRTLGLGRIGHQTNQKVNPSLCGKLRKIWHMVEVSQS